MNNEEEVKSLKLSCEKAELTWKKSNNKYAYYTDFHNQSVRIYIGWRSFVFISIKNCLGSFLIPEPMVMVRPNSPADKLCQFLRKKGYMRPPDKWESMSRDMRYIFKYARDNHDK